MTPLTSLLLPLLLAAVLAFVASFLFHMVLPFHRKDWLPLAAEAQVTDALRPLNIPPGDYMFPHGGGPEAMKDPAWLAKYERGPVATLTFMRSGKPSMTDELIQWFVYSLVVSIFAAYIAGRALSPGADYLDVFRFAGATAFASYALAGWQETIWYKRKVSTSLKNTFDGLVYALVTAGVFGWLWPA